MGSHKTTANICCFEFPKYFPHFLDCVLRPSFICGAAFGIQPKREVDPNPGQSRSLKDSCRLVNCFLHSLFMHCSQLPFLFHYCFCCLLLFGGPQKEEEQGQETQRAPGTKESAQVSTTAGCLSSKCSSCHESSFHGSSCHSPCHASSCRYPGPSLENVS